MRMLEEVFIFRMNILDFLNQLLCYRKQLKFSGILLNIMISSRNSGDITIATYIVSVDVNSTFPLRRNINDLGQGRNSHERESIVLEGTLSRKKN